MITFTYTVKEKYIWWEATWDGTHNEAWYVSDHVVWHVPHPFFHTLEFRTDARIWQKLSDKEKLEADNNPEAMREYKCVCAVNPVTMAMCALLADKDNIHKHSGHTEQYWYWCMILGTLSHLWD